MKDLHSYFCDISIFLRLMMPFHSSLWFPKSTYTYAPLTLDRALTAHRPVMLTLQMWSTKQKAS